MFIRGKTANLWTKMDRVGRGPGGLRFRQKLGFKTSIEAFKMPRRPSVYGAFLFFGVQEAVLPARTR